MLFHCHLCSIILVRKSLQNTFCVVHTLGSLTLLIPLWSVVLYNELSLSVCAYVCVYFNHSDRCVLISHYGFNLHFPNGEEFSCALFVTCISSLVKYTFIFFSHFLTGWFVFPLLAFETSPCILSRGLFQVCDLQTFSPVHRLPFCPLNRAFLRTKVFNFDIIQHIGFSFYVQCFDNKAKNSLLILRSQRFSTLISSKSITGLHFSLMFRIHFELIFI